MTYSVADIIDAINSSLYLNSDNLSFSLCYSLCANKKLFEILGQSENQIIFGRRGTGKTTLLKAFSYYTNDVCGQSLSDYRFSWYVNLNNIISSHIERNNNAQVDDIVAYCIKDFLLEFMDFLIIQYEKMQHFCLTAKGKISKDYIEYELLDLLLLIENGSAVQTDAARKDFEKEGSEKKSNYGISVTTNGNLSLGSLRDRINFKFDFLKQKNKIIETKVEKTFIYRIDLNKISRKMEKLLLDMNIFNVYICIDEFSQIDRNISQTIQPQMAQALKQLFFSSRVITLKIASVWNEQRMQHRQINGLREGVEFNHDIVSRKQLDLDNMFADEKLAATNFFTELLLNCYNVNSNISSSRETDLKYMTEFIMNILFSQNAFECLVCGTQGVPRNFVVMLSELLYEIKDKKNKKIKVSSVYRCVISSYTKSVRQSIPPTSKVCECIDRYIERTRHRVFALENSEYDKFVNYIDGLVANGVIYQYPSDKIIRKIRNSHKFFLVHYGNYLEAIQADINELGKSASDFELYPEIDVQVQNNISEYCLTFPPDALNLMYCTYCHFTFARTDSNNIAVCPKCHKPIAYWY